MKNQRSSEQSFIVAAGGVLCGLVVALLLFLVISIMMLCISCEGPVAPFYAYIGWFIAFVITILVLTMIVPYPDPDFWRQFAVFGWIIIYVSAGIFTAPKIRTAYGTVEIDETSETTMSDELSEE